MKAVWRVSTGLCTGTSSCRASVVCALESAELADFISTRNMAVVAQYSHLKNNDVHDYAAND